MRVIAGSARGRRLAAPKGTTTRPATDRLREAVFNALWSRGAIEGAQVVDLFAGSGAMGIEALSRGAEHAVFVEVDAETRRTIVANLETCRFEERAEVRSGPAERVVAQAAATGQRFDIAFCDPPYAFDGWGPLLEHLPADLAVLESDDPVPLPPGWALTREARYASSWVGFAEPEQHVW